MSINIRVLAQNTQLSHVKVSTKTITNNDFTLCLWKNTSKELNRRVLSYRGYIFRGELVGCVGDKEASFTDGTITHHHTLNGLHFSTRWKNARVSI